MRARETGGRKESACVFCVIKSQGSGEGGIYNGGGKNGRNCATVQKTCVEIEGSRCYGPRSAEGSERG